MGSERRETVRSLSTMRVEELRGVDPSGGRVEHTTGGPVVAPAGAGVAKYGRDNCKHLSGKLTQNCSSIEPW